MDFSTNTDWTIIKLDTEKSGRRKFYICQCKCGIQRSLRSDEIYSCRRLSCKSCACKRRNFSSMSSIKPLELTGKKFGEWAVLERIFNDKKGSYWKCQCSCGDVYEVWGHDLKRGETTQCKSCSARKNSTTHGFGTRGKIKAEYNSWSQMKSRCLNKNDKRYRDYGDKGILVYPEWIKSFEKFLEYVGLKPSKEYSIDRINNEGNYEPGNVRWATPKQQANNRRNSKKK